MMPSTPRSSERAVRPRTSDSTRTSACTPADDAPSSWPSSSDSSPPPCSRSTSSQSKPARPSDSAASGEPSVRKVPNSVSPAARRAFIGVSGIMGRSTYRPQTLECRVQDRLEVAGVPRDLGDRDDHVQDLLEGEVVARLVGRLRGLQERLAGREHAWAARPEHRVAPIRVLEQLGGDVAL